MYPAENPDAPKQKLLENERGLVSYVHNIQNSNVMFYVTM